MVVFIPGIWTLMTSPPEMRAVSVWSSNLRLSGMEDIDGMSLPPMVPPSISTFRFCDALSDSCFAESIFWPTIFSEASISESLSRRSLSLVWDFSFESDDRVSSSVVLETNSSLEDLLAEFAEFWSTEILSVRPLVLESSPCFIVSTTCL
ncbi:MAG: hypothetical protein BWX90_00934 [bacterium ADurb.Bin132]|nr:MAG: hypothetical protein BWX90_00934 [bacterium ADurb.Bin132]